jgi:hypothetical protein
MFRWTMRKQTVKRMRVFIHREGEIRRERDLDRTPYWPWQVVDKQENTARSLAPPPSRDVTMATTMTSTMRSSERVARDTQRWRLVTASKQRFLLSCMHRCTLGAGFALSLVNGCPIIVDMKRQRNRLCFLKLKEPMLGILPFTSFVVCVSRISNPF